MALILIKIAILIALPITLLLRLKIAIDKFGLENYRSMNSRDLYKIISWKDSKNKIVGVVLLGSEIIIISGIAMLAINFSLRFLGG